LLPNLKNSISFRRSFPYLGNFLRMSRTKSECSAWKALFLWQNILPKRKIKVTLSKLLLLQEKTNHGRLDLLLPRTLLNLLMLLEKTSLTATLFKLSQLSWTTMKLRLKMLPSKAWLNVLRTLTLRRFKISCFQPSKILMLTPKLHLRRVLQWLWVKWRILSEKITPNKRSCQFFWNYWKTITLRLKWTFAMVWSRFRQSSDLTFCLLHLLLKSHQWQRKANGESGWQYSN